MADTAAPNPAHLSIVIPVLNEATTLAATLEALQPLRRRGAELVVVDGESRDASAALALPLADTVMTAAPGRGAQMNLGASAAGFDTLLFLHADTRLPEDAPRQIQRALETHRWGRFDVTLTHQPGVIAALINAGSRLTGVAAGAQALFMTRSAFAAAGGFPERPPREAIALSRQLKKQGRPACLKARVESSARP
ncbi:TIGR04283 family arsenosugar biosynthesis glycosyltransferase [Halomonas piscis]|uniref:TIGR04283 family arsenosugar biosynthesis glycosyltransferase n=1 Tax=Halomonas piscis TaxID=3031727 RepID=A0ABY9Z3E9_9GAMM|nr:TIGR04283 family arsenosugar biosynthesis glycosyltransferase [Halomonas piscis]WNK20794.1 TIGR04283 family arsenosugar biosynthesis glycosyltransferase [Halomonas piscis]